MRVLLLVVCMVMAFIVSTAQAGVDYLCTVKRVTSAEGETKSNSYLQAAVGKQFTVDRATGNMTGVLKSSPVNAPDVIDIGNQESSYKVIAALRPGQGALGPGSNIYALTIMEFLKGAIKPFVFLVNHEVYLGECKHF